MDKIIVNQASEDSAADVQQDNHPSARLGHLLLEHRLIEAEMLETALERQRQEGGRIGRILTHLGYLSPYMLYHLLALQHRLPLVNMTDAPPDMALLLPEHLGLYAQGLFIPYRREGDTLICALSDLTEGKKQAELLYPDTKLAFVLVTPRDILAVLQQRFGAHLSEQACRGLYQRFPEAALLRTPKPSYRKSAWLFMLLAIIAIPVVSGIGAADVFSWFIMAGCTLFALMLGFKLILIITGLVVRQRIFAMSEAAVPVAVADLPIYTILVPLLHEAASVPRLIHALQQMDYPAHRMDVKLIVEADDIETVEAIRQARPDARFEMITVPPSFPKTKPKACNYALAFARGEFITIYDAEDAPEPQQLKTAVALFRAYPQIACLQARLNYYNREENLLSRLFSLEYAMLFDAMLPALYALSIPIPLGGTSNHLRKATLERLGCWDAYNVTEDADLGIRLACSGLVTLPIASLTREEAPLSVGVWVKQRTRWIKGYFQTWSVLMRSPLRRIRQLGVGGLIGIHLFIGASSLAYIIAPILWGLALFWWLMPSAWPALNSNIGLLSAVLLLSGCFIQWGCGLAMISASRKEERAGWLALLSLPLYFCLHSYAGCRALWQLVKAPHLWEKTTHGVSRYTQAGLTNLNPGTKPPVRFNEENRL